jgi:hypothetical protein
MRDELILTDCCEDPDCPPEACGCDCQLAGLAVLLNRPPSMASSSARQKRPQFGMSVRSDRGMRGRSRGDGTLTSWSRLRRLGQGTTGRVSRLGQMT